MLPLLLRELTISRFAMRDDPVGVIIQNPLIAFICRQFNLGMHNIGLLIDLV
jgi:hypothetical protein